MYYSKTQQKPLECIVAPKVRDSGLFIILELTMQWPAVTILVSTQLPNYEPWQLVAVTV